MTESEVTDFETSPMGSVREYLVEAKDPAVFDFEGHNWGDLPGKDGAWLKAKKWATTEELRPYWDKWINEFFEKGHDALIIKNIIDIGWDIDKKVSKPHTVVAVSTKAKVEMESK